MTIHISQTWLVVLCSIAYFLVGCWGGYPAINFLASDAPWRDKWWTEALLFIAAVTLWLPAAVLLILIRIITFPWS